MPNVPQLVPVANARPQRHEEDDGGQHLVEPLGRALHEAGHVDVGAQGGGGELEGERERQHEHGGHHRLEAGGDAVGRLAERDDAAREQVEEGHDERDERTPRQRDRRVGVAERERQVAVALGRGVPEAADVHHAGHAAHDEHEHGHEQIPHRGARLGGRLVFAAAAELALAIGLELSLGHGAVVEAHDAQHDDERDGEQRVEVERDGLDEQLDAGDAGVELRRRSRHGGRPARDGGDHAHRRGGGVDDVGELGAGDAVAVGDRAS